MTPAGRIGALALAWASALSAAGCAGAVSPEKMPELVARLADAGPNERARIEGRLRRTPPRVAWPPLVATLADVRSAPAARVSAIRVLLASAPRGELSPLVPLAVERDPDRDVRAAALEAVVAYGDPSSREILERAARSEPDPSLRAEIDRAIGRLDGARRAWMLRELFEGRTPDERALAAQALGEIGKPEDVASLRRAFDSGGNEHLRQQTLMSAARLGGPEASAFIREQLFASDHYIRAAAATAASLLPDPGALPRLAEILAVDPIGDIRISAARALAAIGGAEARQALDSGCAAPSTGPVRAACADAARDVAARGR